MIRTAILVDGAFYRKRAMYFWEDKTPQDRAEELSRYCWKHIRDEEDVFLYRIFYYDCPPIAKKVFHPLLGKVVDLSKSDTFTWTNDFLKELKHQRKFALRLGKLAEEQAAYELDPHTVKRLLRKEITIADLSEADFKLKVSQKGVDMRIGIDISSLAYKHQVDRIVLISGDSDFVPAAKQARREGIDFILDPMRSKIKEDLFEHIDGLRTKAPKEKRLGTVTASLDSY